MDLVIAKAGPEGGVVVGGGFGYLRRQLGA